MRDRCSTIPPGSWRAASAVAAIVASASLTACSPEPAHSALPTPTAAEQVDASHYQTYRNYSGYRRDYVTETQFATDTGIRCRIGPNTGDYDAGIRCWGNLPGINPPINHAAVKALAHDQDTHALITTAPPTPGRAVYSFLDTIDPAAQETYLDSGLQRHTVDAQQYHLLEAGQMIEVQGTLGDTTVSTCAAGTGNALTCEIRPSEGGAAHGFQLSAQGSRMY